MNEEQAAEQFLRSCDQHDRVAIVYHADADGISSAVMVYLALEYLGVKLLTPFALGRGENPFSDATLQNINKADPDKLIVVDSGSRDGQFPENVRAAIIDHHVPQGRPAVEVFFNTYEDETQRIASEAVYDVVYKIVQHPDFGFYVLIGIAGDIGLDKVPPRFKDDLHKYGRKKVQETVSMINAVRRHSSFKSDTLFRMLQLSDSPEKFLKRARDSGFEKLKQEVSRDLYRNLKIAPRFSGKYALLDINSPHQIHPQIAVIWAGKLEGYVVIAANRGYLPGKVSFSMRTTSNVNLLDLLKAVRQEGEEMGYGHEKATGGILAKSAFESLLRRLGF